jgi:hypothetical protein
MVPSRLSDPERRCSTHRDSSPRASLTPSYISAATGLQYVALLVHVGIGPDGRVE